MERSVAHRPLGVTVLVVILWIQALFQTIGGLVLIFARNDVDVLAQTDLSSDAMLAIGIVAVIIGLITAAVANAIGRGSGMAQMVVAVIALLNLVAGIVYLFTISGHHLANSLSTIIVSLVTLYILFGERGSKEFFEGPKR